MTTAWPFMQINAINLVYINVLMILVVVIAVKIHIPRQSVSQCRIDGKVQRESRQRNWACRFGTRYSLYLGAYFEAQIKKLPFVCGVKSVWIEDVRISKVFLHSAHRCRGHLKKLSYIFTSIIGLMPLLGWECPKAMHSYLKFVSIMQLN